MKYALTEASLASLPLAMAYVPVQPFGELYPPETALARGTLFAALFLPFTGKGEGCRV